MQNCMRSLRCDREILDVVGLTQASLPASAIISLVCNYSSTLTAHLRKLNLRKCATRNPQDFCHSYIITLFIRGVFVHFNLLNGVRYTHVMRKAQK